MVILAKLKPEIVSYKPTKIPPGFTLIIDTREQLPLFQGTNRKLPIIRKALRHGDYSVKGMEDLLFIERKQLSDLLQYVGQDRENTETKLRHIREFYFKALIIEAREEDLIMLPNWTQVSPEAIRGFLRKVRVYYGLHVYISPKRSVLERWVLDMLTYAYIQLRKV